MAASVPPNPKLGKSQALNISQATVTRLANLIPSIATDLSPVTVYQPGANGGVGNELNVNSGSPVVTVNQSYGVWVAPDVNGDGSIWYATVECFGAGGGAGGGNATQGGGGGGAGEYAREDQYPIKPGASYVYVVGLPGTGGFANSNSQINPGSAGTSGGSTIFDLAGLGLAGGVMAAGGQGGDQTAVGIGGQGGNASSNTVHFSGGNGGTNVSGNGSDNPLSLAGTASCFVGNTLSTSIIKAWYVLNETGASAGQVDDYSGNGLTGQITNYTGGVATGNTATPAQVPAYASSAGTYGPVATVAGLCDRVVLGKSSSPSAKLVRGISGVNGTRITLSCWIQADPSGTFCNNTSDAYGVLGANTTGFGGANTLKGYAFYIHNHSGAFTLNFKVGDGTVAHATSVSCPISATPGTWYYCVATFNSGTLTLYLNGVSQGTASAPFTSLPSGGYAHTLWMDPTTTANWFFGSMCNFWWAVDALTSTGVAQAFGLTPATGGAGGGASGGPSANGGNGATAGGATGGAGGTAATQPASLTGITTAAQAGFTGANAGLGNSSPLTPAGGPNGAGGGGSGDMGAAPAVTVLTIPFSAAATYAGVDATSNPASVYNPNQQNNTNSGINSVLYAGGLASDAASGSKNSILLLPKGLAKSLGNSIWTVTQVTLTFTNAFPTNTVESILEVGYSSDTVLPQTYNGTSLLDYVGAVPIPVESGTITYDLTPGGLGAQLQNGTATALIIGPGATPTFDAYNAVTGPEFYCSIYGPGAADTFGNSEAPYLTIVLEKTLTTQQGSNGGIGAITVTNVTNPTTPVVTIEPFATTDAAGNQFGQALTGAVANFDPTSLTPGSFKPETWKSLSIPTGMTGSIRYKRLAESNFVLMQVTLTITSTLTSLNTYTGGTLPSAYWPVSGINWPAAFNQGVSSTANADPRITITSGGVFSVTTEPFTTGGVTCIIQNILIYPTD